MVSIFDLIVNSSDNNFFLSYDEFKVVDDLPNESTLEVNVTHEQLVELTRQGEDVVALSPTRYEEGVSTDPTAPFGKGYDITFSDATEIVFQHKAPKKTVVRGQDNRNKRQWLQYNIDLLQVTNLAIQYDPRQAFLALPLVATQNQIRYALGRTVFIDVWDIFARLQQQGLATDYILIEYLPIGSRYARPPFTENSILTEDEYYQPSLVIRGKYAGSQWGMKYNEPDPYYEIAYGDNELCVAQPWTTLRNAFRNDEYGLPIRRLTRTDGGEPPSDEWFDLEIAEQYAPSYREHLKRKYALHLYARDNTDVPNEQIEDWLLTDLDRRYHQAVQEEILSPWNETSDIPDKIQHDQEGVSVDSYLNKFQSARNPIQYRLRETKRYLHQSGDKTEISLIV